MTLIAGPEEYRYRWNTGNVTNSIIVTTEGIYTVEITNGDKCMVERSTEVRQSCSEVVFVPNTFTPNKDWKNDVFTITATNMDKFEFRIFNRWGEVVFYSTDADFTWDGTFKGKPLPDGVYVWRMDYTIKLRDGSYEDRDESGSITLMR